MHLLYSPKFTEIHPAVSLIVPYKVLPVSEIILKRASFSSPSPPPFQTFVGGQILYLNIYHFVITDLVRSYYIELTS